METCDVCIIGSGPAGLSAGINAASEGLKTVIIEKNDYTGGQAAGSSRIENVFAFGLGMAGASMAKIAETQFTAFGGHIMLNTNVSSIKFQRSNRTVLINGALEAKTVVLALGVTAFKPAEFETFDENVYCGVNILETHVAPKSRIAIVGGGNSAGQAAAYFGALGHSVIIYARRPLSLTMSAYLINRLRGMRNVRLSITQELHAVASTNSLRVVEINGRQTDEVFVFTGAKPTTDWLSDVGIARDPQGFILTGVEAGVGALQTSIKGVFAVGDARHASVKRVAVAAGEGAAAVHYIHQYLEERKNGD